MKKSLRCIAIWSLVVLLLTSNVYAASSFPDVDGNAEYAEAVEYLNEIGIMQGDENGNFNPNKAVTRAEMATIICRMLGETENSTPNANFFSDVPIKHWAYGYISQAASLGIIGGYGDGNFGPEDVVTYEQAVTMIVRTLGYENESISVGGYPDGYLSMAQSLDLLKGINSERGALLDRKSVAIIIYNSYHSYV